MRIPEGKLHLLCVTRTCGYSSLLCAPHIIIRGSLPVFRKSGESPVDSNSARLIGNSIAGKRVTQFFRVGPMHDRREDLSDCAMCSLGRLIRFGVGLARHLLPDTDEAIEVSQK